MRIVIVSGLSGSGKSIALHTLEDAGFNCVDNLPAGLLSDFVDSMRNNRPAAYESIAVSVDARCDIQEITRFENILSEVRGMGVEVGVLFLSTSTEVLLTRFNETRRKHPLSHKGLPLMEAIEQERAILANISNHADWAIDTSDLNVHDLRHLISQRLLQGNRDSMAILIQSFGFKHGLPADTDFMFDVRCLPNPHWEKELRPFTGNDQPVIDYLENFEEIAEMINMILDYLRQWIPCFEREGRSYMTISIGCTGGQHRSVFIVNKLFQALSRERQGVALRHRECG
jgi:UPF0042 nucleotide-binding protein